MEFVIDDASVYYFDENARSGFVRSGGVDEGGEEWWEAGRIDRGNAGWIKYLAVDSKQIYITDISKVYTVAK